MLITVYTSASHFIGDFDGQGLMGYAISKHQSLAVRFMQQIFLLSCSCLKHNNDIFTSICFFSEIDIREFQIKWYANMVVFPCVLSLALVITSHARGLVFRESVFQNYVTVAPR